MRSPRQALRRLHRRAHDLPGPRRQHRPGRRRRPRWIFVEPSRQDDAGLRPQGDRGGGSFGWGIDGGCGGGGCHRRLASRIRRVPHPRQGPPGVPHPPRG